MLNGLPIKGTPRRLYDKFKNTGNSIGYGALQVCPSAKSKAKMDKVDRHRDFEGITNIGTHMLRRESLLVQGRGL